MVEEHGQTDRDLAGWVHLAPEDLSRLLSFGRGATVKLALALCQDPTLLHQDKDTLAQQLHTSKGQLRLALKELQQEGLLRMAFAWPDRGASDLSDPMHPSSDLSDPMRSDAIRCGDKPCPAPCPDPVIDEKIRRDPRRDVIRGEESAKSEGGQSAPASPTHRRAQNPARKDQDPQLQLQENEDEKEEDLTSSSSSSSRQEDLGSPAVRAREGSGGLTYGDASPSDQELTAGAEEFHRLWRGIQRKSQEQNGASALEGEPPSAAKLRRYGVTVLRARTVIAYCLWLTSPKRNDGSRRAEAGLAIRQLMNYTSPKCEAHRVVDLEQVDFGMAYRDGIHPADHAEEIRVRGKIAAEAADAGLGCDSYAQQEPQHPSDQAPEPEPEPDPSLEQRKQQAQQAADHAYQAARFAQYKGWEVELTQARALEREAACAPWGDPEQASRVQEIADQVQALCDHIQDLAASTAPQPRGQGEAAVEEAAEEAAQEAQAQEPGPRLLMPELAPGAAERKAKAINAFNGASAAGQRAKLLGLQELAQRAHRLTVQALGLAGATAGQAGELDLVWSLVLQLQQDLDAAQRDEAAYGREEENAVAGNVSSQEG